MAPRPTKPTNVVSPCARRRAVPNRPAFAFCTLAPALRLHCTHALFPQGASVPDDVPQLVIWGAWYVTLETYLTVTLKFTGTEAGAVFGTTALASMITPFFMGLIADRFLATEKLLAILHLIGAAVLYFVTRVTDFDLGLCTHAAVLPVLLPDHRPDQLAHAAATHRCRRRVPVHPNVRHHRLDRHRRHHRQHGHRDHGDALPAGGRCLRRDERSTA